MEELMLSDAVVLRKESFGGLIFNKDNWSIGELNETAYFMLSIIEMERRPHKISEITDLVSASFNISNDEDLDHIKSFIQYCTRAGILKAATESTCHGAHSLSCPLANTQEYNAHAISISDIPTPRVLSAPTTLWWDITAACNLSCKQCYSASGKKLKDELSTVEVFNILEQIAEMKIFFLYFLGGEPLIRNDFMAILRRCRELDIGTMIATNGWYVNQKISKELARIGVNHVRVSIDGATSDVHDRIRGKSGSFDRATGAVRHLIDAGIKIVGVSPTIMDENYHQAEAIIDLAYQLGANEIQVGQLCTVGRASEIGDLDTAKIISLKELLPRKQAEYRKKLYVSGSEGIWNNKPYYRDVMHEAVAPTIMGCGAGRSILAVGPNGKMRACLLYKKEVGDLRINTLREIWQGNISSNLRELRGLKPGCSGCKYVPLCAGSCPMENSISCNEKERFVRSQAQEVHL